MDNLDLSELKQLRKDILLDIRKLKSKLEKIVNIFDTFPRCYLCKEPYLNKELRTITVQELNYFKDFDEENYDVDSCYRSLEEDQLYCEQCLKNRYDDLRLYNSIKADYPDLI